MALRTATREVVRPRRQQNGYDAEFAAIAASTRIDWDQDSQRSWLAANINRSRRASMKAWKDYERIGEVHKAISRAARIAGYAKFRCVKVNPDGTDGETVASGLPAEIVSRISSPFGGTRGLIDRFFALMKVPGDSYLIRVRDEGDDDFDGYHFLSADEIKRTSVDDALMAKQDRADIEWITLPFTSTSSGDALVRKVEGRDMLGRVWLPGRRWVDLPDSPLAALATECEVLHNLTESMKANILNRFALSGLMAFPIEIQNAKVPGLTQGANTTVLDYIEQAMSRNVEDFTNAIARLPILLWAKGESIDQIKHITLDREVFETDLALREELIERILFGLDIQTQATKGSEDANHFSAWAQSDEEVRIAVQPDLDLCAWALTRLVLHDELIRSGMADAEVLTYKIAWDMSESQVRTNRIEDTRQSYDRGLIKGDRVIRTGGYSPEDDRMGDQEYVRLVGMKTNNAYLATFTGDSIDDIDWDMAALFAKVKTGPTADERGSDEEPSAGPGVGDPGSPSDDERRRTDREPTPE